MLSPDKSVLLVSNAGQGTQSLQASVRAVPDDQVADLDDDD
ncbi:hypothetical protein [Streptomyces sp. NBC_00996]|nr:hypothetical protein OG390_24235 [Streptomyces sp. NBC_00996]